MQRGVFAVVKPVGITSAGVTNRIKTIIREKTRKSEQGFHKLKVGHGGTLDKGASGVLVVAIGEDCKKLATFLKSDKYYECVGKLGEARDSYDMDGRIVQESDWKHIALSDVSKVISDHFCGEITQTPPIYSALKYGGKRASDLARKGIVFTPTPRKVTVHSITLLEFQPPFFKTAVHCSSGTYIRSIVHDLGQHLGSAAYVRELCRTKQGPFTLNHALAEKDWTFDNIFRAIENFNFSA